MRDVMRSRWAVLVAVLCLALAGCGDSNLFESQSDSSGRQADLDAGVSALDDGDWQTARQIFEAMDPDDLDPEVAKYKASTYLAEAGFSAIALLRELVNAPDEADSGEVLYDSLSRMFDDDGDGILTSADAGIRLGAVAEAMKILGVSLPVGPVAGRASPDAPTPEATFQSGLYAAVYAVLSVVQQLEYPAGSGTLLLSIGELRAAVISDPAQLPIGAQDGTGAGVTVPPYFNTALGLVYDAAFVLDATVFAGSTSADGSDVATALTEFLTDLGYLNAAPVAETVTDAELRTYLYSLLD